MNVVRQFDVFEKSLDHIHHEIEIVDFDLEAAKNCLENIEDDPMLYNGYKIEGEIKLFFENLGYEFETEKYDYFLCCYQDNNQEKFK
ncbi:DUF7683 domain-containing protein [Flagellimonas okinawensis]|uniref:DUF7683 domain-containing protein n=1 Tax=Flagellimonas okinawensis TaxID=3031324 RepID=A0ABT5XR31_9FLAO|nr:hypothetical protein [[Muricauda] okinawensis]MDF0708267.1 hypothetical protein [[Muricauda] okinawensis]